jgi:ABC-type taurine transport system substrate-binding protein
MTMVQNFITIPGASDTRVYFQNSDNSISEALVSGSLNVGKFEGSSVLVPAAQVAQGTPIVAFSNSNFSEVSMLPFGPRYGS